MINYDVFADIYDWDMGANLGEQDLPLYFRHAVSPVLELGCGTGRVLLPLVKVNRNMEVYGLDISEKMLDKCLSKIDPEIKDRITLVKQDMSTFSLGKKFNSCIIAFSSFTKLFTKKEQEDTLKCVYDHLEKGGILIIDVFKPNLNSLSLHNFEARFDYEREIAPGIIVTRYKRIRRVDEINQVNELTLYYEMEKDGHMTKWEIKDKVRYVFHNEMIHLLEKSGFTVESVFGDYNYGKLTSSSPTQVFIVRKL